jgi:hypothetical protein
MHDAESITNELLRRARLDIGEPVDPRVIIHRLGLELEPRAPRGCHELIEGNTVYYDPSNPRWIATLFHALGHRAVRFAGSEIQDERLVIAVAARLTVPVIAFRRALRAGLGRHSLAQQFGVNETCAALRYGEVTGDPVAIITPRRIYAAGEWPWPAADVLRRMVRERHRGIRAERMRDPQRVLVRLAA